jgi:hypothetical protein
MEEQAQDLRLQVDANAGAPKLEKRLVQLELTKTVGPRRHRPSMLSPHGG